MDHLSVLVTGGSGFIGINLVDRLIAEGYQVTNFDKAPPAKGEHRSYWTPSGYSGCRQPRRGDRGGTSDGPQSMIFPNIFSVCRRRFFKTNNHVHATAQSGPD
jgi:nucleoside-diphosphate-sugar epimerase